MMMAQQKYLHELLQEDQEPFQLKNYIADRRIQLKKRQPSNLIKKACFFSFNDSPDPRKSPLFEFPSPVKTKSPCNAIFLNIPARTTALLLEAALRIQNKPKSRTKISLFGSLRRKLITYRTGKKSSCDKEISPCSCDNGRPSSAVWSDKSLDLDVDTSSTSHSSSSITTPAPPSPCRHNFKERESHDIEMLKNLQSKEEEEEEEEQCSPVSVLDPPFEDDEGHEDFDIESSFAIVQRAKQQLLHKLRRFEKLAELDPVELEKRMLEQEEEDDELWEEGKEEECEIVKQVVSQSDYSHHKLIPSDMMRLITDLISEEETEESDREVVVKRVCRRLESWKEVESNTIDMMVEQDIRTQLDGWNRTDQQQLKETALDIELAIFGLLMEELSQELIV